MIRYFVFAFCGVFSCFVGSSFADQKVALPTGYTSVQELPIHLTGNVPDEQIILAKKVSQIGEVVFISSAIKGAGTLHNDALSAPPVTINSFSPGSDDGFSVAVSKGERNSVNVIDVQGEWSALNVPTQNTLDSIVLSTREDGNGMYNYNLLFGYDPQVGKIVLRSIYLNVNNSDCDHSLLATYSVGSVLKLGESFDKFNGAEAFKALKAAYGPLQSEPAQLKKIMPQALSMGMADALTAYREKNKVKLQEIISGFVGDGGGGDRCVSSNYIVDKYFFPDRIEWSNDLGFLLSEVGYFADSIELLKKIVATDPGRVVAYLNLADSYWGDNELDLAKSSYRKYQRLMLAANKSSKIPQRVAERLK